MKFQIVRLYVIRQCTFCITQCDFSVSFHLYAISLSKICTLYNIRRWALSVFKSAHWEYLQMLTTDDLSCKFMNSYVHKFVLTKWHENYSRCYCPINMPAVVVYLNCNISHHCHLMSRIFIFYNSYFISHANVNMVLNK